MQQDVNFRQVPLALINWTRKAACVGGLALTVLITSLKHPMLWHRGCSLPRLP